MPPEVSLADCILRIRPGADEQGEHTCVRSVSHNRDQNHTLSVLLSVQTT